MHVDVLVSASRNGAVNRHSGLGSRAQALFWQPVAGPAQNEQPTRVERKPDLVGVGDAPVMTPAGGSGPGNGGRPARR